MIKYQIRERLYFNTNFVLSRKYHVYQLTRKEEVVKKWFKNHTTTSEQYEPMTYRTGFKEVTGIHGNVMYIPTDTAYEFDSIQKAKQFIHDYKQVQRGDTIVEEM